MRDLKIDEQGIVSFGNKDRTWNDKKLLETQIKEWEVAANQYLERAGYDTRIDSRSYAEQGVSRIPQIHLGKNVTAMRRQGIPTERGDLYDQIDRANQNIRQNLEEIYQAQDAIHHLKSARLDTERYHPTAKEIGTWYAAGNDSQQKQIAILFEDLKAAYMSEDFMQRKPYPGRIPNVYQSDAVAISFRTKQLLDQIVITAQAQVASVTTPTQTDPVDEESNTQEQEPSPDFNQISSNLENLIKHIEQRAQQRQQPSAPAPIPTPTPIQKIVQQSTYQQEYQRVSAKIKRLIIAECEADPFTVYVPDFGEHELKFIDLFTKYMTEKNGYTNPDRTEPTVTISDYQREYDRRTFEYVVENPSVVKMREGLINLHFDIEREMTAEGYNRQKSTVENGDNEFIEFPVTINSDEREEVEESLQDRLNREVISNHKPAQPRQISQDNDLSL